jgi:hypothetical protein
MLRTGLTAAGLLLAAVVLVAGGRAEPARTSVAHSCGALDQEFIRAAVLSNTEIELLGQSLVSGDMSASDAISETRSAALGVRNTTPRDPSLKLAKVLMHGMFVEYGRAIRAQWKGGNPGAHMYRSYNLANYAHQVLTDAEPPLSQQGCPMRALLEQ